jgi:cobalt-zinc-cadmium resistance protein CzcA
MLSKIIEFSLKSKFFILLMVSCIVGFGIYSLTQIPIGAVPDITNNQVQVITTSRNLSTTDVEQFITYPVELEMVNLPGVKEIRSVSKFGLSVVTIVFEDDLGTYLPRQLIAEKLKSAAEKIPSGFGTPEMGPITTGLGEIYQYTLETKPGYEDQYDATELRTIQDWIVRRQLSGIPGVVEINTWGGYLKEYEVSINSKRLQANNITIAEVFQALENNNSVAGGSYIEKNEEAYFIRGEGLIKSLEDIKNISVTTRNNQPVYIKDIAEVGFGYARRFGAVTGNGEGEKVLGQVMMLKDADSKRVIDAVKIRIAEIETTLPEGVYINGFLDRSELIQRTTYTIAENLLLGFLVVGFIVVLLIGDWRAGLVISSIIPLSFLIAISLMYIFGVDANLMSLGALDFGIIIDGAVIIVEFVAFKLWQRSNEFSNKTSTEINILKDKITSKGASKMLNSAIFGQLIILIVFIPILSLSGIEGKMFRPMALTFSFALIGAMVLCFTWVPVACSMILKPESKSNFTVSTKLLNGVKRLYLPSIKWALNHTKLVLISAVALLILGVFTFTRMGAEFVPTLDEGDFVIQPILKTGKSLKSTVERTTAIEKILLEQFPEVTQVVSRIGAAEVPTDPMSMQDSDITVRLKPKSEWTSADTKEGLVEKIDEALSVFPGMDLEFTQPIEMRFNELITGVRSDIAIKVFGEDLDILARKGNEIKSLIENVDGAADISVEKIVGLPQMLVNYKRDKIGRYGLDIKSINDVITAGFAGKTTGVVFEGEKRFDLVVRLQDTERQNIGDLRNLMIDTPSFGKIPLNEVADITFDRGPAKISRDESKRRIVVGVNVRNRDLESVVTDIQKIIDQNLDLPVGYSMTYGGQFENLESAKERLKIAVPLALFLIYILLFFGLRTHKDALLIFTAIPFSAVGGVFLLWLRDMPFSISAGVGFIALFGIAVLNGIILVEYFKDILKTCDKLSLQHIIDATQDRLRAVLLTASSTALGFLPMAISTGAGAEVQRPLATVVIGGLITSTLLTLIILPVLYALKNNPSKLKLNPKLSIFILLMGCAGFTANAQDDEFESLKIQMLDNNKQLKAAQLRAESTEAGEGQAFTFNNAQIYQNYDESEADPIANQPLYQWGIIQQFDFPTVYGSRLKLNKVKTKLARTQYSIVEIRKIKTLQVNYQNYLEAVAKLEIYDRIYKIYTDFSRMAKRKFEEGESNYLEKITAQSKANQITIEQAQLKQELTNSILAIKGLLQSQESLVLREKTLYKLQLDIANKSSENLSLSALELDKKLAKRNSALAKNELLPGISASYFIRSNSAIDKNFSGYQVGLNIPLLFFGDRSKIKSAEINTLSKQAALEDAQIDLTQQKEQLINQLSVQQDALNTYEENQLKIADELLKTAKLSYKAGEIDFFRYVQSLEYGQRIQLDYLTKLRDYNETIIALNYFLLN